MVAAFCVFLRRITANCKKRSPHRVSAFYRMCSDYPFRGAHNMMITPAMQKRAPSQSSRSGTF